MHCQGIPTKEQQDDAPTMPLVEAPATETAQPPPRCALVRQVGGVMMQPPVVASLVGFAIALTAGTSLDIRAILVDTDDRDDDAPLGMHSVHAPNSELCVTRMAVQRPFESRCSRSSLELLLVCWCTDCACSAVPINMAVLGYNMGSFNWKKLSTAPWRINLMVVFCKMVLMPCVGICETLLLRQFVPMDAGVDASFYLVVMIVTATPTANSIAVMAEFGGQDKDALASCIFTQYLFAPVLLAASITIFVNMVQDY